MNNFYKEHVQIEKLDSDSDDLSHQPAVNLGRFVIKERTPKVSFTSGFQEPSDNESIEKDHGPKTYQQKFSTNFNRVGSRYGVHLVELSSDTEGAQEPGLERHESQTSEPPFEKESGMTGPNIWVNPENKPKKAGPIIQEMMKRSNESYKDDSKQIDSRSFDHKLSIKKSGYASPGLKSFTQPIDLQYLAQHDEGLGKQATSPNSHNATPRDQNNSFIEGQSKKNRFSNQNLNSSLVKGEGERYVAGGSDEIKLQDQRHSVSDSQTPHYNPSVTSPIERLEGKSPNYLEVLTDNFWFSLLNPKF